MRFSILILPVLAALVSATPAAAGEAWQVGRDSFHVYLNDLDLRTAAGRAQALGRIEAVAVKLCRTNNLRVDRDACRTDVVASVSRGPAGPALRTALAERSQQTWAVAAAK